MGDLHSRVSPAGHARSPFRRLLALIRAEYREMPDLRLTRDQAGRLWGLDMGTCSAALDTLRSAGFLAVTRDGAYVRSEGRSA